MLTNKLVAKAFSRCLVPALFAGFSLLSAQENASSEDEVYTLSPFTVSAADDVGYRATTTLAGSRVRSQIKDLGASIAVVTEEFLDDIGATDGESLLPYVGSMEVGGVQGNFSNSNDGISTNDSRADPQSGQRVRGLVRASTTRDYFNTITPFDGYNTDRVTINRGPNSVLFGLGSPGGVINNSTTQAIIGRNNSEVQLRFDHRGSHRVSFRHNQTLIEDRLAVKIALLHEKTKFKQKPALEKDRRAYLTWNAVLFKNENSNILGRTVFKGNFEVGEVFRNPPDTIPPVDAYSSFFEGIGSQEDLNRILQVPGVDFSDISNTGVTEEMVIAAINGGFETLPEGQILEEFADAEGNFVPKSTFDRIARADGFTNRTIPYFLYPAINYNRHNGAGGPGWNDPALAGIQGIMGRWRPNGFPTQDFWVSNPVTGGNGFRANSVNNRSIFDYHNLLFQGDTNRIEDDFDMYRAVLEQELFNGKLGFELAFDSQERNRERFLGFSSGSSKRISIDVTRHHSPADSDYDGVADRLPNENLGRPMVRWDDNPAWFQMHNQDTIRATMFAALDFNDFIASERWSSILGKHTVTGLYEERTNDFHELRTRGSWWADTGKYPGDRDISNGRNDNFRRIVKTQIYLGDSVLNLDNPDQMRIDGPITARVPQVGDEYGIWYFDNDNAIDDSVQNTWRIIENIQQGDRNRQVLESEAFNLQSKFFGGNLVASWARRKDTQEAFQRIQHTVNYGDPADTTEIPRRIDEPGINETDGNWNLAQQHLEPQPNSIDTDSTTTWSVVGYYPEDLLGELPLGMDLLGHYYEAESFRPAGISNNVLRQPLANPKGVTREWGVTAEFFDGKLSIRYNDYETSNSNDRTNLAGRVDNVVGDIGGFFINRIVEAENGGVPLFPSTEIRDDLDPPRSDADLNLTTTPTNRQRLTGTDADLLGVNSYDEYYALIISAIPQSVQDVYNFRMVTDPDGNRDWEWDQVNGLSSTRDFVATGKEIEIVGQITDNWTLAANVAQQKTVTSNTGPVAIPLATEIAQSFQNTNVLWDVRGSPFQIETGTNGTRYEQTLRPLAVEKSKDNTQSQEQREWRVNLVTRYDFIDGRYKGLSIGGALRYQDEVAIGYPNILDEFGSPVPDIANPIMGPDEMNGDMFVRYKRKLRDGKVDWTIQLNARNLYRKGGNDDIPVKANPDGTIATIRIPNSQEWFLTNTFSF